MSDKLPQRIPPCAERMLARPEWFSDPDVVRRARLAEANLIARFLSSKRFSGTENIWAITFGRTIFVRMQDRYEPHTPVGLALLAHELKHVEQYERRGLFQFIADYVREYMSQRGYGKNIRMEAEAYALGDAAGKHLSKEFESNPGIQPCLEMTDPHTPNAAFALTVPEAFRFAG